VQELKLYWKHPDNGADGNVDQETREDDILIEDMDTLKLCLERSRLWEIYYLRAIMTLQQTVIEKLRMMDNTEEMVRMIETTATVASVGSRAGNTEYSLDQEIVRKEVMVLVNELRGRERRLLEKSVKWFEQEKERLVKTEVVQTYLSTAQDEVEDLT